MKQGLFESLTGQFYDATPVDAVPENRRLLLSITDNLTRLFNAREGIIPHLTGYGLPDISELYRQMPSGAETLRGAIKQTVEKYEPRLKNVRVAAHKSEHAADQLIYILTAELLNGSQVRFQTKFCSYEPSVTTPWRGVASSVQ